MRGQANVRRLVGVCRQGKSKTHPSPLRLFRSPRTVLFCIGAEVLVVFQALPMECVLVRIMIHQDAWKVFNREGAPKCHVTRY